MVHYLHSACFALEFGEIYEFVLDVQTEDGEENSLINLCVGFFYSVKKNTKFNAYYFHGKQVNSDQHRERVGSTILWF